ncbi:Mis6-domain-containing protein [Clohesyomyces aquaticus]|uniref:Mis6-domain-containing protein n=1 Tax=Clohesyomyces aquaticus TaxID=1231657 RepID=A0A1Y2A641_9PLEO|nr:Mis6-domain-containing protein [Clohesyomyces aquaticus]
MPSVADNSERPASLRDAVAALEKASTTPAKQRAVKVTGVVDAICQHAYDHGLDEDTLQTLVQIITRKTDLDQTSVTTLTKNLYPAQYVSEDVVVTIVGALGQGRGKPSLGTQNALVKWLTTVYDIIGDPGALSRLYGVLFGMLDMISIRTSLCHLLSLITRRKHVKPFRIQQLLELSRGLGNEPALQNLLRIYKDYYPDIILGSTATSKNSYPGRPDPEWRARIVAVQEAGARTNESLSEKHNGFRVLRKGPKRSKTSVIPEVHTFHAVETSVTLEGIDTADDFVEKLDRIEFPGQLISFLTDPLLQKYLLLIPSEMASHRIDLWLSTYLEEEYEAARSGMATSEHLTEILEGLYKQTRYTKILLNIALVFLKEYLVVWDGIKDIDAIIGLLSYIPLQPFQDVYATYLGPLERTLAERNPNSFGKLLSFYTDLMCHWMAEATPHPPGKPTPAFSSPHQRALAALVAHISEVSTSLLLSLPLTLNAPLVSSILSFYEVLSSSSKPRTVPILLPSLYLAYLMTHSHSVATISRTCGIYGNYKKAFDSHPKPIGDYYSKDITNAFNMGLRDIFNSLWTFKALVTADEKSYGFFCQPSLRDSLNEYLSDIDHHYGVALAFGLSYNPSISSLAAAAWRSLEEGEIVKNNYDRNLVNWHKGPVSERTLKALNKSGGVEVGWDQYRLHLLEWMADKGCNGFRDFMFATVKNLKG